MDLIRPHTGLYFTATCRYSSGTIYATRTNYFDHDHMPKQTVKALEINTRYGGSMWCWQPGQIGPP